MINEDFVILYICQECDREHYFRPDSLPGGNEHCQYCEECGGKLESEFERCMKIADKLMAELTEASA